MTHVRHGDARFDAVLDRQFNKRFRASPDSICIANSADDIIAAVNDAVRNGLRLVVTSGGHCLEGFVSDPDVRVIIDVSPMKRIYFDPAMRAVAIEAGATVGDAFKILHESWGVVVPLGEYPQIGIGGHVAGGAFGFLCRALGLAVDYLHAVEVVTVDASGSATRTLAMRDPNDPNHDLWWGLTGAGGGNFGIVTRYWFRSPNASGDDPVHLLPRSPESVTTFKAEWNWSELDERAFLRLLRNHGTWCEQSSDAASPNASLWTLLQLPPQWTGKLVVRGVSIAGGQAEQQIDEHLSALGAGVPATSQPEISAMSWLGFALDPFPDLFTGPPGGVSSKVKDALIRKRLTDDQIRTAYRHLTSDDSNGVGGMLGLATYGGQINTVAPDATASAQRGSILDIACNAGWVAPNDAAKSLAWVRGFYRDLFAESGGVPTPGDAYDGAFINHPDTDLRDPAFNTSGVPWHTIYFRENYPRLQRVKARWDPRHVFHHALSIERP